MRTIDLNQLFEFPKFSKWNDLRVEVVSLEERILRLSRESLEFMEIVIDENTWNGFVNVFETEHFKHKYGAEYDYFLVGTSYTKLHDIPDNCRLHVKVCLPSGRQNSTKTKNMYQKVEVEASLDVFHLVNTFALKKNNTES